MNLYLYSNQGSFFESHDLLVSGTGSGSGMFGKKYNRQNDNSDVSLIARRPDTLINFDGFTNLMRDPADGIGSSHLVMPTRNHVKLPRGHCVLISGYFVKDGELFLRCRNSFGPRWGFRGDFSMRAADLAEEQVHKLVYIPLDGVDVQVYRPFE